MMPLLTTIGLLIFCLISGSVFAQEGIDQRQEKQEARIEQGSASGQLTPAEQKRLEAQQKHIQKIEDKATVDGIMTGKEKARIARAQNRSHRKIYRKKHNRKKLTN